MSASTCLHDLKMLVQSFYPVIVIETVEEARVSSILWSLSQDLKISFFEWSLTRGLVRVPGQTGIQSTIDPVKLFKHMEGLTVEAIFHLKDFAPQLKDPAVIRQLRELAQQFTRQRSCIVLTGPAIKVPAEIEHLVVRYELAHPGAGELRDVIKGVVASLKATRAVSLALNREELEELLRALRGLTLNQARQAVAFAILEDGKLSAADIQGILDRKGKAIRDGGVLEYFPAEDNRYEIGGFGRLKAWLEQAHLGFSERARELNLHAPRGILLVGVQGCGKSLAAKAIARHWKLPLLKLDAGRLYDKYVGESEKNFRKALGTAEALAPVVLWIDEIEKCMSATGSGDADAGLSRRIFGSFLTWLQEKKKEVFVVATANDVFILPPELVRKGRFDEIFFVDLPDAGERRAIFEIHLRLRKQDPQAFDLERLVAASDGFSGAEIEAAVISALYRGLFLKRPLDTELVLAAVRETIPLSVSRREDIERLRETAHGRFQSVR